MKASKTLLFRRSRLALIALGALLLAGCHKEQLSAPESLPVVTVRVQSIELKSHVATEDAVGTVRPKLHSVIEAKVSAQIEKMLVVPGQRVKTGELLAQLDVREIQAKLDQALPVREQAEDDLKRYSTLIEKRAVTQQEFQSVQMRERVAKAAVIEAETTLGYAKITAPFDGVITRKLADVGDLATPGKPLLEMEDTKSLRLEADVPEAIIEHLELGAKFNVRIASQPNELEGVVSEIAPAGDPNSRTFVVKLDLPPSAGLRAGQFGRVAIPVSETAALRVPASAVIERVLKKVDTLKGTLIPADVQISITRHYGETALEKSNELLFHMLLAVLGVSLLILLTLGWRESVIVLIAIPSTLALTLLVFYLYGYTLNRITLFALIFSIGILVDDAIVVVENIVRHFHLPQNGDRPWPQVAVEAVNEVGNPTILATQHARRQRA